jgi:hypothetical protein
VSHTSFALEMRCEAAIVCSVRPAVPSGMSLTGSWVPIFLHCSDDRHREGEMGIKGFVPESLLAAPCDLDEGQIGVHDIICCR